MTRAVIGTAAIENPELKALVEKVAPAFQAHLRMVQQLEKKVSKKVHLKIAVGAKEDRATLIRKFIGLYFERTQTDLTPGTVRAVGNSLEIMPVNERVIYRIAFDADALYMGVICYDSEPEKWLGYERRRDQFVTWCTQHGYADAAANPP